MTGHENACPRGTQGQAYGLLSVAPQDNAACRTGFGQVDEALVGGAAKTKGNVFQFLYELSVHQHVDEGEQLVSDLAPGPAFPQQVALIPIAGVGPDVLLRETLPHPAQEGEQGALVLGLKGFAAQQGQSADKRGG